MKFYQTTNSKDQEVIVRVVTRKSNTSVLVLYTIQTNEISTIELLSNQSVSGLMPIEQTQAFAKIKKVESYLNLEIFQIEKHSKVPIDSSN